MNQHLNDDEKTIDVLREILSVADEMPLGMRSRLEAAVTDHHRRSLRPSRGASAVVASVVLTVALLVRVVPGDAWSTSVAVACALAYAVAFRVTGEAPPPPSPEG
jgi:hypothetical protein